MEKKKKRGAANWEKIFSKHTSDKGLVPKKHKELSKLNNKKTNNPVKKWAKSVNRYLAQ